MCTAVVAAVVVVVVAVVVVSGATAPATGPRPLAVLVGLRAPLTLPSTFAPYGHVWTQPRNTH